ncbi:integrase [Skermania sp. ID1734]|nr:integrase [Skermania sp. ID1734]
MRGHLSALRNHHTLIHWRCFAHWLDRRGITELAQVSESVLGDYSIHLVKERRLHRNTVASILGGLTRLHAHAPLLPESARIRQPPWETEGVDDYLPAATPTGENASEAINPATMGPLLVWALRFVEMFATDILAADAQAARLRAATAAAASDQRSRAAVAAYLADLEARGLPLPAHNRTGTVWAAKTYIAAITGAPLGVVSYALRAPRWRQYLAENPGPCPLDVPITATVDGQKWIDGIDFHDVAGLVQHLDTAAFIVIAYLTGMRPSEVLGLQAGCCPDPPARQGGTRRHLIRARVFKTAYDEDGNHLSAGEIRCAPWVAVPQVVTAIRLREARVDATGLLFAGDPTNQRPGGRAASYATLSRRIEQFVAWVNTHHGEDAIPADPHGNIGTRRFRRTLAWHIARRPGGLVALAVQYGHLRTIISEGYAGRQREGIHDILDLETARAVAEHLSDVEESLADGGKVSGPAARRLILAAHEQHRRFGGMVLNQRQAKALLSDPALTVFHNPEAYLSCNYDPAQAQCNPENLASQRKRPTTPSLDRCRPSCANIARTDSDASQLRERAQHIRYQADTALTPEPIAERLRHHARELIEIADRHERTRLGDKEPS